MSIKNIIIIAVAALLSFGAAFSAVWFTKKQPAANTAALNQASILPTEPNNQDLIPKIKPFKSMPEKRLENLIDDVRNKIAEYNQRHKQLDEYESRLEMSRQTIKSDIDRLTALQEELSQAIITLKSQQQQLQSRIVQISQDESERLQQLAAVYDKMEETASAKILTDMMTNNQLNDAAKIVFFMSEKGSAKVLTELTKSEPALARVLSSKIKYISQEIN